MYMREISSAISVGQLEAFFQGKCHTQIDHIYCGEGWQVKVDQGKLIFTGVEIHCEALIKQYEKRFIQG